MVYASYTHSNKGKLKGTAILSTEAHYSVKHYLIDTSSYILKLLFPGVSFKILKS